MVGIAVGAVVGYGEGCDVVGRGVGWGVTVGSVVGRGVGILVGKDVGSEVGTRLGAVGSVGSGVGGQTQSLSSSKSVASLPRVVFPAEQAVQYELPSSLW